MGLGLGYRRFASQFAAARIGDPDDGGFFDFDIVDRRDPSFVTGGVGAGEGLVLIGTASAEIVALSAATARSARSRRH